MDHYHHLSISERERILFMCGEGKGIREIAAALGRAASTISRELKRNKTKTEYSPSQAEKKCRVKRKCCCPIANAELFANCAIAAKHAIKKARKKPEESLKSAIRLKNDQEKLTKEAN